jgi:hypothetical protein
MIKYLGRGRMRLAFKVGNIAIKLPYNFSGVKACIEESKLWSQHKLDSMAPVLFGSPFCVAMPYYEQAFTGDKPVSFIQSLNSFGIVDLHPYNIRLKYNGKPVAIDYAINKSSHGQGEPTGGW